MNHCMDKDSKVCLAVTAPLQNEVVYKTVCGKFLLIATGYQTKERIPAKWIAVALLQAVAGGKCGPAMACDTLEAHRCRDREPESARMASFMLPVTNSAIVISAVNR